MTAATNGQLGRPRDPLLGAIVNGRFRVEEPLARGGMGRVYLARQAHIGRLVALKVVVAEDADPESRGIRRFLLEASILAKIQHPNVVTLYDYGRIEGAPAESYFIAMEYLRGESLAARLRSRPLSVTDAMGILRQLLGGLREAHAHGVIHRDLKPSNIVLARDDKGAETAKLVDFGVGKLERGGENLTKSGVLVGTPKYMAPEQFEGACSTASDVYALGLVAYEMFAGALPFSGSSAADFMIAKVQRPLRSRRAVAPTRNVPEPIDRLVRRMLSRRPEDRPRIEELHDEVTGRRAPPASQRARVPGIPPPLPTGQRRPPPLPARSASCTPKVEAQRTSTLSTVGGTSAVRPRGRRRSIAICTAVAVVVMAAWLARDTRGSSVIATRAARTPTTPVEPLSRGGVPVLLRIESSPGDALVIEDGLPIGRTPVEIALAAATRSRAFRLEKDGYTDVSFIQPPADTNVTRVVVLAPAGRTRAPASKVGASIGRPGLDIRHER